MKPASMLSARFIALWRTEFPSDVRTMLFCFFVGSLLSVPCGLLIVVRWELFQPPLWTAPIYCTAIIASLLVLPFWSVFALREQPFLRRFGLTTSVIAFTLVVLGLLFPALQS
jgi:hypothetical protein